MTRAGLAGIAVSAMLALAFTGRAQAGGVTVIPYATDAGPALWHVQVAGTHVESVDASGKPQWSVSPSNGAAADCAGVIQYTLLLDDTNADGLVDTGRGEHARLYVSSSWRDGAGWQSAVLALDVSRPGTPQLLWRHDADELPRLGRLVAAPTILRLRLDGTNRVPPGPVVLLGGGLPTPATSGHGARDGAALLMLDAIGGTVLWTMAASGKANQHLPALTAGISGAVTALDLNHDGLTDRLYVGDADASLWRFDLAGGRGRAAFLAGGRLARLADPSVPLGRSLIAAPDVALIATPGIAPWFNVAVGTVQATGATVAAVSQGLFVLRDRHPFDALGQDDYDGLAPVAAADLPATADAVADSAPGFRIDVGGAGILARALTTAGVLLYTQVSGADPLNACAAATQIVIVKVSAVSALDGHTALDLDANGRVDAADRAVALPVGKADPLDGVRLEPVADAARGMGCRIGTALLSACPRIARLTRRYWRREDAD